MNTFKLIAAATGLVLAAPSVAAAHAPDAAADFASGLMHSLTGADHLAALLAIGFWAGRLGGSATRRLPALFGGGMAAGAFLAAGGATLPGVEVMVVASLAFLAIAVARSGLTGGSAGSMAVGIFGAFHGQAHMIDFGPSASVALFALGFLAVSAALMLAGIMSASALRRPEVRRR